MSAFQTESAPQTAISGLASGRTERGHPRALVGSLIREVSTFVELHHVELVRRLRERIFHMGETAREGNINARCMNLYLLLDRQENSLRRSHLQALRSVLERECAERLFGSASDHPPPDRSGSLELVAMSEVERTVLVERIASSLNNAHFETLQGFTRRLAPAFDLESMEVSANPLRPAMFVRAWLQGWHTANLDLEADDIFAGCIDAHTFHAFEPLYAELHSVLSRAGVADDPAYHIKKAADVGVKPAATPVPGPSTALTPAAGTSGTASDGATDHHAVAIPEDPSKPRKPYSVRLAGAVRQLVSLGLQVQAQQRQTLPDGDLMQWLTVSQAELLSKPEPAVDQPPMRVLAEMVKDAHFKNAPPIERVTAAALAEVYDRVFDGDAVPTRLKSVVGRLQLPVLKAAMLDRRFFSHQDHPARQLMENIVSASAGWRPSFGMRDPLYRFLDDTSRKVLTGMGTSMDAVHEANQKFGQLKSSKDRLIDYEMRPYVDEIASNEKMELALHAADECLHAHLQGHVPADFMVPFLLTRWRLILAHAFANRRQRPEGWQRAVATTEGLIWSVEPKPERNERLRMVTVLPRLASSLNMALDALGWRGEPRDEFTKRMVQVHSALALGQPVPDPGPELAQREAGNARAELAALAERRNALFNGGDEALDEARAVKPGDWFDFIAEDGQTNRYRVSLVSPRRSRVVFTLHDGSEAFVRRDQDLARVINGGKLRTLDTGGMVTRAIAQMLAGADAGGAQVIMPPGATAQHAGLSASH